MKKAFLLLFVFTLAVATTASSQNDKPSISIVTIGGEPYYVHTVKPGETFYSLTRLYGVSEEQIVKNNPQTAEGLVAGQVIKISVTTLPVQEMTERQKKRQFEVHTVNQGETAYSISKRYGISINTLIEDNEGFDPLHLSIGQRINIRIREQGKTSEQALNTEMNDYREALNSVSPEFTHHLVQRGETLYSLGRQYNMPIDSIRKYNEQTISAGLKEGTLLRIPVPGIAAMSGTPVPSELENLLSNRRQQDYLFPSDVTSRTNLEMKPIDIQAPVRIAMLLPLRADGQANRQYLEFYQGALLALDELKALGISTQIDLFNTARSEEEVRNILSSPELRQTDLIIGPVYENITATVADFARANRIPMVSPLASLEQNYHSLFYQAAPPADTKNDKLRTELAGDKNIVVISSARNDPEFEREIEAILPREVHRVDYYKGMSPSPIENALSSDKENIFVLLSRPEDVEGVLAMISSVQNNLVARSIKNPVIQVVGNSRWMQSQTLDKNLFFKLNVMFITSYHADRGNTRILNFDRKYIGAYSSLPTLYSYRGYDVTKLFAANLKLHGARFGEYLNDGEIPLLQNPYHFSQPSIGQKYVNESWALVRYNSNYTIEVK